MRSSCRKRTGSRCKRRTIGVVLGYVIAGSAFPAAAVKIGGSEVDLTLDGQQISIASETPVPLRGLIEAIGAEAGIEVSLSGDLGMVQPAGIERRPLDQAIRQLAGEHSLLMIYGRGGPDAGREHLAKVVIYAATPPDERAQARAQARARQRSQASTAARPLSDDTAGRIRSLAEDGLSPGEISQQINMPVDQVQRHLQTLRQQN
jgi:hypothetical protein